MIKTIILLASFVILNTGQTYANGSNSNNSSHMKTSSATLQPIGHYEYCKKYSRDCSRISWDTAPTKLNKSRWKELVSINAHANYTIRPVTDLDAYNQDELWVYPTTVGDCEDYVLLKRKMLLERGWPASSLLITVVKQSNGDGHAVLTVKTDMADFILDNLSNKIEPWYKTPYRYIKRQNTRHSGKWTSINDARKQPGSNQVVFAN